MIDTRLETIQRDAEALYSKMSGKPSPKIKVVINPDYISAAAGVSSHSIHVNPYFVLTKEELKEHYPDLKNPFYDGLNTKPQLAEKARLFTLAHEVAHLYHKHTAESWDRSFALLKMVPSGVALCPFLSFWPLVFSLIAIQRVALAIFQPLRKFSERFKELQADLTAVNALNDLKGFQWFIAVAEALKSRSWAHPPPFKRLDYVTKHAEITTKSWWPL